MHDASVPMSRLVTLATWFITGDLISAAWIAYLVGDDGVAHLLGYTACCASAVAATCNVRCYALRLSRLVRAVGGLTEPEPRVLHALRD